MGLTRIRADQISDIDYKQAVRVLTLTNVTLSGGAPSQVDGVNLNFDDRILVAGQSTASQNGLYYVATLGAGSNGTWTRTSDANATGEIAAGMIVMITEGDTYADTSWKLITNNPIVIGTTGLVFAQNTGDSFGAINANGTAVVANTVTSTAIFNSGNNLVLTGNATSDTITFAVSDTPTFTTVSATGNISGSYLFGNGSQITGLPAGYSNADVATYLASNSNVTITSTGNVTTTANISGNYILGNGSQLTGLPAGYANSNAVAYGEAGWAGNIIPSANNVFSLGSPTALWASVYIGANTLYLGGTPISANNVSNTLVVSGNTVVTASPTGESSTTGNVMISGNVTGGNVTTGGYVSATGNVIGNYIIGNGALLTNINASNITGAYSNANVSSFLAAFGSNTISTSGTINSGNVIGSNLLTGGLISATGNVTGNYIIGNASLLTSLTGANVTGTVANATYATSAGSAVGTAATVTTNAQSNITSVGTLTSLTSSGLISTTGNVTGNYIIGDGSLLTNINAGNITGAYSNANVANYLPTFSGNLTAGNISVTGALSTANITISGDLIVATGPTLTIDPNGSGGTDGNVVITGNLTVQGTTTTINSNTISTNDLTINMANNAANATAANNGGIEVGPVGASYATLLYNTASNVWVASLGISSLGNISTTLNSTRY